MTIVKARKNHSCDWCGFTIEKGAPYDRETFFEMDGVFCRKMHLACLNAAREISWSEVEEIEIGENYFGLPVIGKDDRPSQKIIQKYKQEWSVELFWRQVNSVRWAIRLIEMRRDWLMDRYGI